MTTTVHHVELPTGVRIEYARHGRPDGTPLVLLHGWTDSWRSFERVLPHLPDSICAYAVSFRGHGESSRPAIGYDVMSLAADVDEFMTAVGLDSAAFVGHSMGGVVAARLAIDVPERVDSLVLAGSRPTFAVPDLATLYATVGGMRDPIALEFVHEFQESTIARPVSADVIRDAVRESLKVPIRVWRASMYGTLNADISAELSSIEAPTLIVAGERDQLAPRAAQDALVAAIPGSRMIEYAGGGHGMHWESPERFACDVSVFVQNAVRAHAAA
jgi:pimeloyl-ACP methyl ester carboxylesterase